MLLLFLIAISIFSGVLLYHKQQDKPWSTALKETIDSIAKFFESDDQPQVEYPAYIGFDEFGIIKPQRLEKMFKKVLDDFQDSLYVDRTETQNVVLYVFKVSNFKPVISDCSEKVDYIRKRAYACFSNEIQQLFPEVNFPEDIIRIRLNDERLEIGIAINTEGIKENSHFNEALHKRLKQNSICGLFQNNAADDVKKNL